MFQGLLPVVFSLLLKRFSNKTQFSPLLVAKIRKMERDARPNRVGDLQSPTETEAVRRRIEQKEVLV